jgi:hypothetical protein
MLRRFNIARLAFQHSPEKEQRLLSFATTDPTNTNNPEKKEAADKPQEQPEAQNPVDALRMKLGGELTEAAPEHLLSKLKDKEDALIEVLSATGGISELSARIAKEFGYQETREEPEPVMAVPKDKRAKFIDRLVLEASDEELLRLLTAARGLLDSDEKRILSVERNLKPVIAHSNDPTLLEKTLDQLYRYETVDEGHQIDGELKQDLLGPDNIVEKVGLEGAFSAEDRKHLFEALKEIVRTNKIRRALGQRISPVATREEQGNARTDFVVDTQKDIDVLGEFIDKKINARAQKLIDRCDEISKSFSNDDQQVFHAHGVTALGIQGVLKDRATSMMQIRREFEKKEDNRSERTEENFIKDAQEAVAKMNRLEDELQPGKANLPKLIEAQKETEKHAEAWTYENAKRVSELNEADIAEGGEPAMKRFHELKEYFQAFIDKTETADDVVAMRHTTAAEQRSIMTSILILETNPALYTDAHLEPREKVKLVDDIEHIRIEFGARLKQVLGDKDESGTIQERIAPYRVFDSLGMKQQLTKMRQGIESNLQTGVSEAMESAERKLKALERCDSQLARVTDSLSVVRVESEEEYRKLSGTDSFGWYNYEDGKIYLNSKKIETSEKTEDQVLAHEKDHAFKDAFRRSGVFPNLLLDVYSSLEFAAKDTNEEFEELLRRQAKGWEIPIIDPKKLSKSEKWKLTDELTNRFAEWQGKGAPAVNADLEKLFRLFRYSRLDVEPVEQLQLEGGVHLGDEEDDALGNIADAAPTATAPIEQDVQVDSLIEIMDKRILDCDEFLKAYPQYTEDAQTEFEYPEVKRLYAILRGEFKSGAYLENPNYKKQLKTLTDLTEELLTAARAIDVQKSDLTYVQKENVRTLRQRIAEDINWVSLPDMWTMIKDAGSDITRMWKRRGEGARNSLGKSISEMIPKEVPFFGRLRYEFERRDRESEEEEVGVWEKGLDKIDSHVLQHEMLPHVFSRDHLKGIIRLIAKRGRLDWEDEHLWHKLEYHSGYKMPYEACHRNNILRNQWLQKMIADIWRDNDLFEHWKAENDGAIDSGRKHVDPYVEDLSAGSALRTELRKLLFNFTKLKNGQPIAKEEEVNPHLYEGIIFYAMRNGKMSMEEKFFYLVKGVQIGLLSVDRLRTFSGENFGILNTFPFIDFFSTGQNCTMHEIEAICAQITETGPNSDPFKPGARMTKFLMERVAFDKNVSDRVNKALKRAENIDHEDIPMLLTQVDYAGVNQIVNFTSGSQAKVSAQAMMNGYVGYNSFLKYFGMKAVMGRPPITDRDVGKIATTLGAYAMWDNLITRNSIGAETTVQRPFLSWQQINDQAPVSGDQKTKVYRDKMNAFTVELCQAIGIHQVKGFDVDDFIGIRRSSKTPEELKAKYGKEPSAIYKIMEGSPQHLVDQLIEKLKIKGNRTKLTEILQKHEALFIPENGDFTLDNVQKFWNNGGNPVAAHRGSH